MWGGVFDINANWQSPHFEHKRGTVIDIRANQATGSIPFDNFELFNLISDEAKIGVLLECTRDKKKGIQHKRKPPDCISTVDGSQDSNRHYHIRLWTRGE